MRIHADAAIAALLLWCGAAAAGAGDQPLPVAVRPDDPHLRYVGRFDFRDAKGPRCAWSASSVTIRFKGTSLNAIIADLGNNRWQVVVDGHGTKILKTVKGAEQVYSLASGLGAGEHTVELFKRTEALLGAAQITGFQLDAGGVVLDVPPRAFRIEVIGDSITCGYGDEGKNQNEHFNADTENAYLAYGAVASRAMDADYVSIAWSGRKLWPDNTVPEIYGLALPGDPASTWNFAKWIPDVVLINLGTNDFAKSNPNENDWVGAYEKFVKRIRSNYPKALIMCASGPMMSDYYPPGRKALSTLNGYLGKVVDDLKSQGDDRVRMIAFQPQDPKSDGLGSDWHPSVKTHEKMARLLREELSKYTAGAGMARSE